MLSKIFKNKKNSNQNKISGIVKLIIVLHPQKIEKNNKFNN